MHWGEQVRLAICERFPQAEVLVHKDPVRRPETPTAD